MQQQSTTKSKLIEVPCQRSFIFNENLYSDKSLQSLRNALSYRNPQTFIDPNSNLQIVCVPAYSITEEPIQNQHQQDLFNGRAYIKAQPKNGTPYLKGIQSGKRSCLLHHEGKLYRLKGCGNLDEGFTILEGNDGLGIYQEIRGCCFEHTVKRELFITNKISQILKKYDIQCGNESVGYWEYGNIESINEQLEKQLINSEPLIPKYCGIYETIGDQRLGTHLLQGLRIVTQRLLEHWTLEEIKALVKDESRFIKRGDGVIDLKNTQFRERTLNDEDYLQVYEQVQKNQIFDQEEEKKNINLTQLLDDHRYLQDLSVLYERLGYEVGRIKRIFIDHQLNWGYFRDHSEYIFHCNAHLDNFIVIPQETNAETPNLLAPLDFDLAFFKDEFIKTDIDFQMRAVNKKIIEIIRAYKLDNKPIDLESIKVEPQQTINGYGKFDDKLWGIGIEQERLSLELAMTGVDIILQSSMFVDKVESQKEEFFEILLKDQMRIGYIKGFQHQQEDNKLFHERREEIRQIVSESLEQTEKIIA